MLHIRLTLITLLSTTLLLAGPTLGQSDSDSFEAQVIVDSVEVTSGGVRNYAVGNLSKDDKVTVLGPVRLEDKDLYKIKPPADIYCYIPKAVVDLKGGGTEGVVNQRFAKVYLASQAGANDSDHVAIAVTRDKVLEVVGETPSLYKIKPPAGTVVFIPKSSVKPVSAVEQAGAEGNKPKEIVIKVLSKDEYELDGKNSPISNLDTLFSLYEGRKDEVFVIKAPADLPMSVMQEIIDSAQENEVLVRVNHVINNVVENVETTENTTNTGNEVQNNTGEENATNENTGGEELVDPTGDLEKIDAQVKEAEKLFAEAMKLPVEKQPLADLLATYQILSEDEMLSEMDRYLVERRIAQIKRNQAANEALKAIEEAEQTLQTDVKPATDFQPGETKATPNLKGKLLASAVFDGKRLPHMLRLVDLDTGRTLGYLDPQSVPKATDMIGKQVEIVGSMSYDQQYNIERISASEISAVE